MQDALLKACSFIAFIVLGYILKRVGIFKEHEKSVVTKILMYVTLPCSLVVSFASSSSGGLPVYAVIGLMCVFIPLLVNFITTYRYSKTDRAFMILNASGYNIGCFALPFIQTFFSANAVVTACMFDAGNAVFVTGGSYAFAHAALKLEGRKSLGYILKQLFSSIPFDTYILILLLSFAGIAVPQPVITVLKPAADANAFTAMFLIGLMLHLTVPRGKKSMIIKIIAFRTAFAFGFALLFYFCTPFSLETRSTLCLLAFAPASALSPIFSEKAGCDAGMSGFVNSVTILISLVFIMMLVLGMQGV